MSKTTADDAPPAASSAPPNKLVIISGRSGSGKSTALHLLEDAGFYCIDNLPANLLPELARQAEHDGALQRSAVSIDARNMPSSISRFPEILDSLPAGLKTEIVYLDANDATLIKRFSETRRKHPLSQHNRSLAEALSSESLMLQPIAARAALTIDTSQMSLHDLRDHISKTVLAEHGVELVVLLESFGYKHGVPSDADLVFDLRCLVNPHWVSSLRHLSGQDQAVIDFLEDDPAVKEMLADIGAFIDKWLPCFERSNRSYVTVAFGCTGGHHRSVYMAEAIRARLQQRFPVVQVRHRDLGAPRSGTAAESPKP